VTIKSGCTSSLNELSDQEADEALRFIAERRSDPIVAAFRDAPDDDEPVTIDEKQARADSACSQRSIGSPATRAAQT